MYIFFFCTDIHDHSSIYMFIYLFAHSHIYIYISFIYIVINQSISNSVYRSLRDPKSGHSENPNPCIPDHEHRTSQLIRIQDGSWKRATRTCLTPSIPSLVERLDGRACWTPRCASWYAQFADISCTHDKRHECVSVTRTN